MASISTTTSLLHPQSSSTQPVIYNFKHQIASNPAKFRIVSSFESSNLKWNKRKSRWKLLVRAVENSDDNKLVRDGFEVENSNADSKSIVSRLQGTISTLPPVLIMMKRSISTNHAIGLFVAVSVMVIAVRVISNRNQRYNQHGSVADLVKRGQLRSDRRGIAKPLKYDDPFNNPLVKVQNSNSTVEMCGKVYRLAPVTLTEEQQSSHQKRRSRAYEWKRPTIFLKEGDAIPPDVDPDTIRWIPANHPFATTVSEIDEKLAQNNVYQKDGVPFRIKAEHEALQRKLEALQTEQKLNKIAIDPSSIKDFDRPFKSFNKRQEQVEQTQHTSNSKSDRDLDSFENGGSEELQKP